MSTSHKLTFAVLFFIVQSRKLYKLEGPMSISLLVTLLFAALWFFRGIKKNDARAASVWGLFALITLMTTSPSIFNSVMNSAKSFPKRIAPLFQMDTAWTFSLVAIVSAALWWFVCVKKKSPWAATAIMIITLACLSFAWPQGYSAIVGIVGDITGQASNMVAK